jgi:exosome complex exonuclease DIS3/RRP44
MITQKQFYKKTKKGSIIKLVNEVYLRSDIHCGLIDCPECLKENIELVPTQLSEYNNNSLLDVKPRKDLNTRFNIYHFIVPDASAILYQLDVLEDSNFGENIIILQSVLDEVRKKNLQIYLRLKQLISSKNCYIFTNIFNKHTYAQRKIGETNEEYQDRLVRIAVNWYNKHLNDVIACILITDFQVTKNNAINENIFACLVKDCVQDMVNNKNLVDKLSMKNEDGQTLPKDQFLYPEHLNLTKIHEGITENRLFQGKFQTNQQNYLEATVGIKLNNEDVQVLIQGKLHINRAIHEDIVAIELLPENEWTFKSGIVLIAEEEGANRTTSEDDKQEEMMDVDVENKDNQVKIDQQEESEIRKIPCAKVVGIIKRNWRQYCGVLKERDEALMKSMLLTSHLFVPAEKRIPFIRIETISSVKESTYYCRN